MKFHIVTAFPNAFDSYLNESIMKRAQDKKIISVTLSNLRDYAKNTPHKQIDDRPYGGGPGMVLQVEPIYKAVTKVKKKIARQNKSRLQSRTILFGAKGKQFDSHMAERLARYKNLILICGHYEGVDERVSERVADEEVSIGPYILTGGELPAMVMVDAVARLLPGTLGKHESIEQKRATVKAPARHSPGESALYSYPVYTRPEDFSPRRGVHWRVPKVLLSGNHKEIALWRKKYLVPR